MKLLIYRVAFLLLAAVLPATATLGATSYVLTDLGSFAGDSSTSFAYGINSIGQVTGSSEIVGGGQHPFLWSPVSPNSPIGSKIEIPVPIDGPSFISDGASINDSGQIAGRYQTGQPNSVYGAYLWSPTVPNGAVGSSIDLGNLHGVDEFADANGINSRGQVAGVSDGGTTLSSAFVWTPTTPNGASGSMVALGTLTGNASSHSVGSAINGLGQVVGQSDAPGARGVFLWTPTSPNGSTGTMIDLGFLGISEANAINSAGEVVGSNGLDHRAFIWKPSTPNGTTGTGVTLGVLPGGNESHANGINSQGVVVGEAISKGNFTAMIWIPTTPGGTTGTMVDLNTLLDPTVAAHNFLATATAINDAGQIIGYGFLGGGTSAHAFLLTPVPEPATAGFVVLAMSLLALRRSTRTQ